MNFTLLEKLAIVKALDEIIMADLVIDPKESDYMASIIGELKVKNDFVEESRQMRNIECLDILNRMSIAKKKKFAEYLHSMIVADGYADESEINMIISLYKEIGLNELDEEKVQNIPDINFLQFTSSIQYKYISSFQGDRKALSDLSKIKIEATPEDPKKYYVTIFNQSDNYPLWGIDLIYPTHNMLMKEINDEVIIMESENEMQKIELNYDGIEIIKIRFADQLSGLFYEFVN